MSRSKVHQGQRWRAAVRQTPLLCALAAACTGQIGDGAPSSPAGRTGSGSDPGTADAGEPPSGSLDAAQGDPGEASTPPPPFHPLGVASYVTKVKTLLTGLAPTQAEIDGVNADPTSLGTYVDGWMQLPAYTAKMELFFADAFQQSQASGEEFKDNLDDGVFVPSDPLLLNLRQSFAKTMTELVAEGHPFTEAATTTTFMMTTAMMVQYAYADASMLTDATATGPGSIHNRYVDSDKNWSWSITAKQAIPIADSANPTSPNYLRFYDPNLAQLYVGWSGADATTIAHCASVDPVVFTNNSSFAFGGWEAVWLYDFLRGGDFRFFDPPVGSPGKTLCMAGHGTYRPPTALTDSDYSDWRMVTITPATGVAQQTPFFDVAGIRAAKTLSLYEPRVGYFTTPSFFAQYPTNISNQGRGITNQTMIVGLGRSFDGSTPPMVQSAPGDDPAHASDPGCFQCHWNLDPMKRFFRSNYTLNFSTQGDPAQTAIKGTFMFGGVMAPGTTMYDLAKQIAVHPDFKTAWTQKLCAWANSGQCQADDPELVRIAGVFANSNYSWNTLVHELFTSPLVTYASPTTTAQTSGGPVAIARYAQLCSTLGNRLGLGDVCGLKALQGSSCSTNCAPRGSIPAIAITLPSDGYSRGSVSALYVDDPDPFYRSSVEQICALVADRVVDAGEGGPSLYSSATPASVTSAIAAMAQDLMGLDSSRSARPIDILTSHYTAAKAAGSDPTVALKSTFTMACLSPWVVSIGE